MVQMQLSCKSIRPDLREDGGQVVFRILQGWYVPCSVLPQHVWCHASKLAMKLLHELFQPDLREDGGQVMCPTLQDWIFPCRICHRTSDAMYE